MVGFSLGPTPPGWARGPAASRARAADPDFDHFTTQARLHAGLIPALSRGGARPGPSHRDPLATPLREPGLPWPDPARMASKAPMVTLLRAASRLGPHPDSDNVAEPSWRPAATRPATSLSQLWTARAAPYGR